MEFIDNFINIRLAYIRGWAGWEWGWGGWWQRLKQRNKKTQIVEFRVVLISTCTHKANTTKLEPSIGTILPVIHLHGWQKAL